MRKAVPVVGGLAIALHLIDMIGDAIDFRRRILNRLGRTIGGLGRFVRCRLRLLRIAFGLLGGSLGLCRRRFGLRGLLIIARRASHKRKSESQCKQPRRN